MGGQASRLSDGFTGIPILATRPALSLANHPNWQPHHSTGAPLFNHATFTDCLLTAYCLLSHPLKRSVIFDIAEESPPGRWGMGVRCGVRRGVAWRGVAWL